MPTNTENISDDRKQLLASVICGADAIDMLALADTVEDIIPNNNMTKYLMSQYEVDSIRSFGESDEITLNTFNSTDNSSNVMTLMEQSQDLTLDTTFDDLTLGPSYNSPPRHTFDEGIDVQDADDPPPPRHQKFGFEELLKDIGEDNTPESRKKPSKKSHLEVAKAEEVKETGEQQVVDRDNSSEYPSDEDEKDREQKEVESGEDSDEEGREHRWEDMKLILAEIEKREKGAIWKKALKWVMESQRITKKQSKVLADDTVEDRLAKPLINTHNTGKAHVASPKMEQQGARKKSLRRVVISIHINEEKPPVHTDGEGGDHPALAKMNKNRKWKKKVFLGVFESLYFKKKPPTVHTEEVGEDIVKSC